VAQEDCPLAVTAHYLLAIARAGDARCKELAHRLQERGTQQGQPGIAGWLCLLSERPQALDALAGAGDWVVHTREGRYLQAVLQDHHRWTWRPRQLPLMLTSGSGGGVYSHLIADLGDEEPTRYVDHLPLPI